MFLIIIVGVCPLCTEQWNIFHFKSFERCFSAASALHEPNGVICMSHHYLELKQVLKFQSPEAAFWDFTVIVRCISDSWRCVFACASGMCWTSLTPMLILKSNFGWKRDCAQNIADCRSPLSKAFASGRTNLGRRCCSSVHGSLD